MSALDNLKREVSEAKTASKAAAALLRGLKAKLDEAIASGDMSQVEALSQEMSADSDALAAAVTENTPAEEEPEEPPEPPIVVDPIQTASGKSRE